MNRVRAGRRIFGGTLALLCSSCGGAEDGSSRTVSVDTLATGTVRIRNPAEGALGDQPWRAVEGLRIGAVESTGPNQFGQVRDVTVDALGRLYVLEGQTNQVRVFSADGDHVRTFGREGSGPGELARPIGLEWGPDGNLWITDSGNRRYEVFDTTGVRLTSHPLSTASFGFGNMLGSDGLVYEQLMSRGAGTTRRTAIRRRLVENELVDVDTVPVPTIPESETMEITTRSDRGSFTLDFPIPLAPRSLTAQGPDGAWWISDPGADYRIVALNLEGDTVRIIERAYTPIEVTDAAWARALEGAPEGAEIPDDRRAAVHPAVRSLAPSAEGLLVSRQVTTDRVGYDVFDPDGRYLGELQTDVALEGFRLFEWNGDALYGSLRDELDVPYVVRLDIER